MAQPPRTGVNKGVVKRPNGKFKGATKCTTPHLYEKDIKRAFVDFANSLITDRDSLLQGLREVLAAITDNAALERERDALQEECEVVMELIRKMVQENALVTQDQGEYNARYSSLTERYDGVRKRFAELSDLIASRNAKRSEMEGFLKLLEDWERLLTEFDESLWMGIIDKAMVHSGGGITFVLKDENKISFTRVL